jgi:hypothetical protein
MTTTSWCSASPSRKTPSFCPALRKEAACPRRGAEGEWHEARGCSGQFEGQGLDVVRMSIPGFDKATAFEEPLLGATAVPDWIVFLTAQQAGLIADTSGALYGATAAWPQPL